MDKELLQETKSYILNLLNNKEYEYAHIVAKQASKVFDVLEIQQLLGLTYFSLNEYKKARKILYQTVKQNPNPQDYNNLSLCERFLGNYQKSFDLGMKAIVLNPSNSSFYANLSTTAKLLHKNKLAIDLIDRAIDLQPNCSSYYFNKGSYYFASGNLKQAEESYKQGLRIPPVNEKYCVELFYALATQKKYQESWKFYEFRYNTMRHVNKLTSRHNLPVLLERKPFYDDKLAIIFEQGLGDNLMYLRFITLFQKIAPNSYLLVDNDNLKPFVEKLPIKQEDKIVDGTSHMICIMSLPYHLNIDKIPEPLSCVNHQTKSTDKLKIGLVWAGSAYHPMDLQRSTFLKFYDEILKDDSFEIYSFMKDRRKRKHKGVDKEIDYSEGFENYKIIDLSEELTDCYKTALLFNQVDVLITVDTFVAHIAGTCGVPTYLIVSDLPDWRWGRKQKLSDWYPSVKIFRKKKKGNYQEVISEIYKEIKGRKICP